MAQSTANFKILEVTVDDIHSAYKSGQLTCRQLVQMYLDRIEAFDKKGPAINTIITISSTALQEADRLDAAYKTSGPVGTLHGIPVVLKDQVDAKGMPTTLGSVLFKNYYPDKDAFVVEKLKNAGAIILGKTTLGEEMIMGIISTGENLRNQAKLSQSPVQRCGNSNALEVGVVWFDEAFDAKMTIVTVKAMSPAYFRMLERYASLKDVFALGNRLVWMTPNGTALVIDADGAETLSDAEIDKLFVAKK